MKLTDAYNINTLNTISEREKRIINEAKKIIANEKIAKYEEENNTVLNLGEKLKLRKIYMNDIHVDQYGPIVDNIEDKLRASNYEDIKFIKKDEFYEEIDLILKSAFITYLDNKDAAIELLFNFISNSAHTIIYDDYDTAKNRCKKRLDELQKEYEMTEEDLFNKSVPILRTASDLYKVDPNRAVQYIIDSWKKINEEER